MGDAVGLYEKRIMLNYRTEFEKKIMPTLKNLGGLDLEFEVAWDAIQNEFSIKSFGVPRSTYEYLERHFNIALIQPLKAAIASITVDEMGKDLLKKSLNKIVFTTDGANYGVEDCYKFGGGVLIINQNFQLDEEQSQRMCESLTKIFEKNL